MFVYELRVDADMIDELELVGEFEELDSLVTVSLVSMSKPEYELTPNVQSVIKYESEDKHEFTVYVGFDEELDLTKIQEDSCWVKRV